MNTAKNPLLDFLAEHPKGITAADIARAMNRERTSVLSSLSGLKVAGRVTTVGSFRYESEALWVACEQPAAPPKREKRVPQRDRAAVSYGAERNIACMQELCRKRLTGESTHAEISP